MSTSPCTAMRMLRGTFPAEDERVFLLDQGLSFRSGILDGDVTFAWRDLSGDPGDMWEFVVNSKSVPKATSGVFEMTVLQCMYERVSLCEDPYALQARITYIRFFCRNIRKATIPLPRQISRH